MSEAEGCPKIVGEDRISALPDDILLQILLLVPTKDAVATTFLSKRWRFVWRKLPRLEYKEKKENHNVQSKSIWWFFDESMRYHNASLLEKLSIKLGPQCPVNVDVVKWVAIAVDRYILHQLKFKLHWNSEPIIMPKHIYTCKTLTKLTLSGKIFVDVPFSVYLPSLYKLDINSVVYKDGDSHVRLLSGCHDLKCLKVTRNEYVDDNVRKFSVKVPSLLKLTYINMNFGEVDDNEMYLVIDTPSLTYLHVIGEDLGHACSIEYMPLLIFADICIGSHPEDNFLRSISSVQNLTLNPVHTMVPWCNIVYHLLTVCYIWDFDLEWCESFVVLLSNCPNLGLLVVESSPENQLSMLWNQPSYVPKCMSTHLKIFKWRGYAGREVEKEFIRYILGNSDCLKLAHVSLDPICNLEEKQKIVEELEAMPTISSSLEIF